MVRGRLAASVSGSQTGAGISVQAQQAAIPLGGSGCTARGPPQAAARRFLEAWRRRESWRPGLRHPRREGSQRLAISCLESYASWAREQWRGTSVEPKRSNLTQTKITCGLSTLQPHYFRACVRHLTENAESAILRLRLCVMEQCTACSTISLNGPKDCSPLLRSFLA